MLRKVTFLLVLSVTLVLQAQKKEVPAAPTPITGELVQVPGWPLSYFDLVTGTGVTATTGKRVKVHYTGWLENGKRFDSSVGGRPYAFVLGAGKVIRGWDVGVEGMKVGGKRQLHIPPSMAYGMAGSPPSVPPNAKLIFEIELLEVSGK